MNTLYRNALEASD